MLLCEVLRNLDIDANELVAAARAVIEDGNTLSAKAKNRSCLRTLGDRVFDLAVKRRNFDLRTEYRLGERYRNIAHNRRSVSREDMVGSDGNRDEDITVRASVRSRASLSAKRDRLSVVDTCGDIDGELL